MVPQHISVNCNPVFPVAHDKTEDALSPSHSLIPPVNPQQAQLNKTTFRRAWGAQSLKCLTLDLGSGHDLAVHGVEPTSGSALTAWNLLGILLTCPICPSPARTLSLSLSLSLKINKLKKKNHFQTVPRLAPLSTSPMPHRSSPVPFTCAPFRAVLSTAAKAVMSD